MPPTSLRPASAEDRDFVLAVCRATMSEYHRIARGWDDAQIEAAFAKNLDLAITQIILDGSEPAGILSVARGSLADWIVRIGVLPAMQGRGIGTTLIQSLQQRGSREGRPIRLYVYKCNPSQELYRRLGFQVVRESEVGYGMMWKPTRV